jgi:hypothetical protein
MIAVDTDILVRLLTKADPSQAKRAAKINFIGHHSALAQENRALIPQVPVIFDAYCWLYQPYLGRILAFSQ